MNLSAEPFGKRRKRARPPGQSQQATTDWRKKWTQFSQASQADPYQGPSYQSSIEHTQPALEHSRHPAQTQRQADPMAVQVVDLTDDVKDEESEAISPEEQYQDTYQRLPHFDSRPLRQDSSTAVPRARNAHIGPSTNTNRNKGYASRNDQQGWDHAPEFGEDDYEQSSNEPLDMRYSTNRHNRPPEQRGEFAEGQHRQQRLHNSRREQDSRAHRANYREDYSPEPRREYAAGRQYKDPGIRHPHDYPPRGGILTADALPRENRSNAQSGSRNVKQWLKTSVPTPAAQYHHADQQRASQFNVRSVDDSVAVNVPDSQESSPVDDHDDNDSTVSNPFPAPPLLDQRAHQIKVDNKKRFARIRLQNTESSRIRPQPIQFQAPVFPTSSQHVVQPLSTSKVRFRDELPDNSSAATPAKRQKVSRLAETGTAFDPFEPPPGTPRAGPSQTIHNATAGVANGNNRLRIPPEISTLSEAELRKAQKEEEGRTATRIAREREKLLEQDEDLLRIRREERQAQLKIDLDEAKAATMEEHQKRMASMEEKQRAIDEKAAKLKAEEEKRKAARAEKERLAKKEEQAALHEAALQRSIQARKEHEALKAKKAAAIAARREECKGPPVTQKPTDGPSTNVPKPSLHGALPNQKSADDAAPTTVSQASLQGALSSQKPINIVAAVKPRAGPKTPGDRRREVEEAKAQAEAQEPLGLREIDLQNLMKKEKAEKQAEVQRQREEKRKRTEEEKKAKQLRREERRKEKVGPLNASFLYDADM